MFETYEAKSASVQYARMLRSDIQALYGNAKSAQDKLKLYQDATDPAFNAAINALFTAQERTELAAMLAEINALITDWEANHRAALGI